jgi:hypothetical protein
VLILFGVLFPAGLHAGAWTQEPHHGQLILTFSYLQTSRAYDETGTVKKFEDEGSFRQIILNPYLEYGLSARNTLVFNVQTDFLSFQNTYGSQSSAGLGDVEVSIKRRLNAPESPWVMSGQLTVMFPAYSADRIPAPGNHQEDIETRFMLGHGANLGNRHAFWDIQAAYRARFGAPADQFRSDLTAGVDITRNVMAMGQFFNTWSLRNGTPLDQITNPNAQSDFDVHKCEVSLVFTAPHRTRIQAGWTGTLAGRNVGRGQTLMLSLWKDF